MRITDFPELIAPTGNDLLVTVDIANDLTKKVKLDNLPISLPALTALATKQDTLVSGTNIKTLNSTSLLGSGNIVLTANPSGVAGAIQFSNGSAFSSDATNFFWDDTNKRLGIGTNAPIESLSVQKETAGFAMATFIGHKGGTNYNGLRIGTNANAIGFIQGISGSSMASFYDFYLQPSGGGVYIGSTTGSPSAKVHIKGSGSTSATTSLLVQNSAGAQSLKVSDDNNVVLGDGVFTGFVAGSGQIGRYLISAGTVGNVFGDYTSFAASAIVQCDSTTRGFLPPRMTTTQKNAIASPARGLIIYDNTTNKLQCYNGSTWNDLF
jgi:hypothetical protein